MKPCDTTSAGEFHPFRAELPPTPSIRSIRHWQRKSSPIQTAATCRAHHVHALLSSPQTHKQRVLAPSFRDEQLQHREGQDRTQGHTAYRRRSWDLNQVCEVPKVKSDPSDGKAGPYGTALANGHPHPATAQRPWKRHPQRSVCAGSGPAAQHSARSARG